MSSAADDEALKDFERQQCQAMRVLTAAGVSFSGDFSFSDEDEFQGHAHATVSATTCTSTTTSTCSHRSAGCAAAVLVVAAGRKMEPAGKTPIGRAITTNTGEGGAPAHNNNNSEAISTTTCTQGPGKEAYDGDKKPACIHLPPDTTAANGSAAAATATATITAGSECRSDLEAIKAASILHILAPTAKGFSRYPSSLRDSGLSLDTIDLLELTEASQARGVHQEEEEEKEEERHQVTITTIEARLQQQHPSQEASVVIIRNKGGVPVTTAPKGHTPGAYLDFPGRSSHRTQDLRFSLVGQNEDTTTLGSWDHGDSSSSSSHGSDDGSDHRHPNGGCSSRNTNNNVTTTTTTMTSTTGQKQQVMDFEASSEQRFAHQNQHQQQHQHQQDQQQEQQHQHDLEQGGGQGQDQQDSETTTTTTTTTTRTTSGPPNSRDHHPVDSSAAATNNHNNNNNEDIMFSLPPDLECLIEATCVEEESSEELTVPESVQELKLAKLHHQNKLLLRTCLALVCVLFLAFSVGLMIGGRQKEACTCSGTMEDDEPL